MKYLHTKEDIFFSDIKSVIKQMGGYHSQFSSKIYDIWINYLTPAIQAKIELNLEKFVLSGEHKIKSNWN